MLKKLGYIALIILGILPLIRLSKDGPSSILILSVFVLVFVWKGLQKFFSKVPLPLGPYYIILGTILGIWTQYIVQIEGVEKTFSKDFKIHLLQALTIYVCVTIAWYINLKKYQFSTWQVFWLTGVWGFVIEGIILNGALNPGIWLFHFLVYGSYATIPFLLTRYKFSQSRPMPTKKNLGKMFLWLVLVQPTAFVMIVIMSLFGIK